MIQASVPAGAILELSIRGPVLATTLVLQPGDPEVVLGRDAGCQVCLPDPNRNVSRRHLAVCNVGGLLHVRVLSAVNGVWLAGSELRPGDRGSIAPGQAMRLGDYDVTVLAMQAPAADDLWSELETQAAALEPAGDVPPQEDPFGDWFTRSTFGPDEPAHEAATLAPARDLAPFLGGLGLEPAAASTLTEDELRQAGVLARALVEGLLQLRRSVAGSPDAGRGGNPLDADVPLEAALHYLFGGDAASAAVMPPLQALNEVLADLRRAVACAPHGTGPADAAD